MNGIVCKVCGYIALDGEAPESCPVCGSPKTAFKEKEDAVNTPENPESLEDFEKKHTPDITVVRECGLIPGECQDAHVRVGIDIVHPMVPDHFVGWVDFYVDKKFIARSHLTSSVNPGAGIHLKKDTAGTLSVVEWCNKHGCWMNETSL